jgi:hypothetical protein
MKRDRRQSLSCFFRYINLYIQIADKKFVKMRNLSPNDFKNCLIMKEIQISLFLKLKKRKKNLLFKI